MLRISKIINSSCTKNFPIVISSERYSNITNSDVEDQPKTPAKGESKRLAEFRKKLRETTPIDDLGDQTLMQSAQADDPLPSFPNNTNPMTGEVGGPRGPEPTRYGDWERKGRVTDF